MTLEARIAGHRGRQPVGDRLPLRFVHEYASLPEPTYPINVTNGVTHWGMLGNGPDPTLTVHAPVGDCTFAGRQHLKMAKAAAGHEIESWETSNQLVEEYLAYNHGQDIGANISQLLLHWYRTGKILAFAPVDYTNPRAVDAAMAAFGGVYCGVNLTDDADELFSQDKPWTVAQGQQPDPNEGHCIVKVIAHGPASFDGWITWGAKQASTTAWTAACLDEAWVIITEEDAKNTNLDLAALRAELDAIPGHQG